MSVSVGMRQTKAYPIGMIFALFLVEVAFSFEATMIFAAVPTLTMSFGDPAKVGWLIAINGLFGAAANGVAGRLGDLRGRKQVTIAVLALGCLGSVISASTSNFYIVLLGRALQGLCYAVLPLAVGILRERLPQEKMPVAIGYLVAGQALGALLGMLAGGFIVDNYAWQALFVFSAALLAISIVSVLWFVPGNLRETVSEAIDWIEGLLPVPAIMGLLLGINMTTRWGWADPRTCALFGAAILLTAYWVRRSLCASKPFINLRLFAQREIAMANAMGILISLGTINIGYIFASYMQSPAWTGVGLGLSATLAGVVKLPSNLISFAGAPLAGWMAQRRGPYLPVIAGGALGGAGWLFALTLPQSVAVVIMLLCVISLATQLINAVLPTIVSAAVPIDRTSEAVATMLVVRGFATATGAQILAQLLASSTVVSPDGRAHFPGPAAFEATMWWIAMLTVAAFFLGVMANRKRVGAASSGR